MKNDLPTGLPPSVRPYHRTAEFTELAVPKGLQANHSTKPGVWGVIHVTSGALLYTIQAKDISRLLQAGETALIEPETEHHVNPKGAVCFYVEFLK